MREVELKAVVPDVDALRANVHAAGARAAFAGALTDRRYDTPDRALVSRDHVLRVRTFAPASGASKCELHFKGPTRYDDGYKVRDEFATAVGDARELDAILGALGYVVIREIEREIESYELDDAGVRIERYPRLDTLVEVEGAPDAIERAIARTGIPRAAFTTDRLPAFVAAFEARTGTRAALCARELAGDYRYAAADA